MRFMITRTLIPIAFILLFFIFAPSCLIQKVGGDFSRKPEEMSADLSPESRKLLAGALEGIDPQRLMDYHVHLVGTGTDGTGAYVNPNMQSWLHPIKKFLFAIYVSATDIQDLDRADREYRERLKDLVTHCPGRFCLLALDQYYNPDGTANPEMTEFYLPNEYLFDVVEGDPDLFIPAVSIHPYRKDAVEELVRCRSRGARIVKWLPNAQGIDPSDERCIPFYWKMRELNMILLTHTGEEKAVESEADQCFGNPLLLRKPLDMGVRVIAAHCASLGENADLDDPDLCMKENFDLFLRLMDTPKYKGLLFGDISALLQINRLSEPVLTLLERDDLHHRLVNGSDYPLPAINFLFHTSKLVSLGMITEEERACLNEVYDFNPLLFDFLLKRTIRHPESGKRFPPELFMEHPGLQ